MNDAIAILMNTGLFVCVEPHYVPRPLYTPNDPDATTKQYYLAQIKAYQAWSVTKGDTNIVVGITDTGFDLDHPDMLNAIKYNYMDPVNGIDDDGDGYIDNYTGFDLADNDNNPTVNTNVPNGAQPYHGAAVSGIAAARADNSIGVAGIGFNCLYLPIKIAEQGTGDLIAAYE